MTELKELRSTHRSTGYAELQKYNLDLTLSRGGKNGEGWDTDEAEIWKRVLSFRVARHIQPQRILETHPGKGVGTYVYKSASPNADIYDNADCGEVDLIDVDPFGWPWETLDSIQHLLLNNTVLFVTSGEIQAVSRNLTRAQFLKTVHYGKQSPIWVKKQYIPELENRTGLSCQFFFAFPTMVRVVLSRKEIPLDVFSGCPTWMSWFARYG